jgi:hypothetical protein
MGGCRQRPGAASLRALIAAGVQAVGRTSGRGTANLPQRPGVFPTRTRGTSEVVPLVRSRHLLSYTLGSPCRGPAANIRVYVEAIYWTKVSFDTFVSHVRDERDVERCGHPHQVRQRIDLHLAHHLASVGLHRDLADAELDSDLFIQEAGDDQCHDLPFARGERGVTVPKCSYFRPVSKRGLAALDGLLDGIQQRIVPEWLGQELHRAGLHRLHGGRHVAVTKECRRSDADREAEDQPVAARAIRTRRLVEVASVTRPRSQCRRRARPKMWRSSRARWLPAGPSTLTASVRTRT